MEMNPRYLAYCKAHGNTPDAQMELDVKAWPGGCMTGFILWMGARWAEFHKMTQNAYRLHAGTTRDGHKAFDAWLPTA